MTEKDLKRFLSKVIPVTESGCWIWEAGTSETGYGVFQAQGKGMRAHRVMYEHFHGPVKRGYELDHLCRVRCCVNPDHLEVVTHTENMKRGARATQTHCKYGHAFSPENTYFRKEGGRRCRTCAGLYLPGYKREWRKRRKAALQQ